MENPNQESCLNRLQRSIGYVTMYIKIIKDLALVTKKKIEVCI